MLCYCGKVSLLQNSLPAETQYVRYADINTSVNQKKNQTDTHLTVCLAADRHRRPLSLFEAHLQANILEVWLNWTQKPADQYLNTSTLVYSHVSVFTCACVCVCVCVCVSGLPRGGASGTDARRFTVWDLMGSGNVLFALSLCHDTL